MITISNINKMIGSENLSRVFRGGSWYGYSRFCRSADRYGYDPTGPGFFLGLRIILRKRTP